MNYYFETAPAIELNKKIQQQLIELDRKELEPADNLHYDINADKVLKIIESRLLDKSNFEKFYGKNLSNLASCVTWNLPTDLEKEIFHNYQDFFKLVDEVPDIRLQSIFGNQLPLHIDKDRTVVESIKMIFNLFGNEYNLSFANGGDQNNDTIPERPICEELKIELIDGLGKKIQSSSWLIK